MKTKVLICLTAAAFFAFLVRPAPGPARPAPVPATPAAAAAAESHPEIQAALHALENARNHLQKGAHDFGGHRVQALRLTEQAIEQCHAALSYDRH